MTAEWKRLCTGNEFELHGDRVAVTLPGQRRHVVKVVEEPQAYVLTSPVIGAALVAGISNIRLHTWERNRGTELVGFRFEDGRLIGESWVPKAGLTAGEFRTYLRALANEADRFEFQLTGKDVL